MTVDRKMYIADEYEIMRAVKIYTRFGNANFSRKVRLNNIESSISTG